MKIKPPYRRHGKLTITTRIVNLLNRYPYCTVSTIVRVTKAREDTVRSILHKGIESGRFVRTEADWNAKVRGRHLFTYAND